MRIISQVYVGDGKFMLQLGGLSTETKPTDSFVANGSQFIEDDTDAVFTFSGSWALLKNGQMKDLPVVTATDNGKILKVDNGVWSIGIDSGSSLPSMTGKNGKVLGVTLDAQEHEQIEWVTPSGGGAEKFIVTLTQENDTWTADKTVAEIVAADAADKIVVAKYPENGMYSELPLNMAMGLDGTYAVMFIGLAIAGNGNKIIAVQCVNEGSGDAIAVNEQPIPTSSNAPLIVTLTAGETEGQFVGDKTYKEAYDAYIAGCNVVFYAPAVGVAQSVNEAEHSTDYVVNTNLFIGEGSANDYITVTVGG